jgi:hypothetical protein
MKPGDHPEFFRFPAPPGLSRESRIVLNRFGDFFHEGEKVERASLARAMHSWLSYHPDDGRPILENGYDWCYLTVEDTAHFVAHLRAEADGPHVLLSSGHEELLRAETLQVDAEGVAFVEVLPRGASQPVLARFLREAQIALEPWLADEPLRLVIDGRAFAIGTRA